LSRYLIRTDDPKGLSQEFQILFPRDPADIEELESFIAAEAIPEIRVTVPW